MINQITMQIRNINNRMDDLPSGTVRPSTDPTTKKKVEALEKKTQDLPEMDELEKLTRLQVEKELKEVKKRLEKTLEENQRFRKEDFPYFNDEVKRLKSIIENIQTKFSVGQVDSIQRELQDLKRAFKKSQQKTKKVEETEQKEEPTKFASKSEFTNFKNSIDTTLLEFKKQIKELRELTLKQSEKPQLTTNVTE